MSALIEASKLWADRKTIAMKRHDPVEEHVMKMNAINSKLDQLLRPEVMAVDICPVFFLARNTNVMQASGLFVIRSGSRTGSGKTRNDIQQSLPSLSLPLPFVDYKIELLYNRPLYPGESNRKIGQGDKTDTFIYQGKTYGSAEYFDLHNDYYKAIGITPPWTAPDRHGTLPKFVTQKTVRLIPKVVPVEKIKATLSEALGGFDVIIEPMIGDSVLYELSQCSSVLVPVPVTEYRIHFMSVKGF